MRSTPSPVSASPIFSETFNRCVGLQTATEIATGLKLSACGAVAGWTAGGTHALHAVDIGGGDCAVMFWQDNSLTENGDFAANNAGTSYRVALGAAPTLYSGLNEATTAADGLIVSPLRADDTVLASQTIQTGAWAGSPALTNCAFNEVGDGSGNLHFKISTAVFNDGHFGGALDNLRVSDVPEPATVGLVGHGGPGAGTVRGGTPEHRPAAIPGPCSARSGLHPR